MIIIFLLFLKLASVNDINNHVQANKVFNNNNNNNIKKTTNKQKIRKKRERERLALTKTT
jgi:hypothetical protein